MSGVTVPNLLKLAVLSAVLAAALVRAIERPATPVGMSARPASAAVSAASS